MSEEHLIESYEFGAMTIDGVLHQKDLIILPDRVLAGWRRREGHSLHPDDCQEIIESKTSTLVLGIGAYGAMKVPESTKVWLRERGIELVAEPTGRAWETFNRLRSERVVGAFHLTC